MTISTNFPSIRPALLLNFLNTGFLDPRITFTRASIGTYFDSSGILRTSSSNMPRFDYNPVTKIPNGLYLEEQRTNLLTYSEQFDNADWIKFRSSITANATTSPDGTIDAEKLVEDTSTDSHGFYQSVTVANATSYAISIFAKAAERTALGIRASLTGSEITAGTFDLSSGTVTSSGTGYTASISNVGNGWFRCSLLVTSTVTSAVVVICSSVGTNLFYTGNGTSGIFVWGAQIEAGPIITSYIPTVATTVTRNADLPVMTGTNFSNWYKNTEGTIMAEFSFPTVYTTSPGTAVSLDDGTTNNYLELRTSQFHTSYASNFSIGGVAITGLDQVTFGTVSAGAILRQATGYITGNSASYSATTSVTSADAFSNLPATTLRIGNNSGNNRSINGYIREIAFYRERLTNTQLQALTTS